jgi:hypothetical protein
MSKDIIDEISLERPVFVPKGEYRVRLRDWKKFWHFSRLDLVMGFEIVENDYCGVLLPKYYQVKWDGEQIVAGWKSDFCRDYQQCFGAVERTDQFEISEFEDLVLLAEVREVNRDQEKRLLAKVNQYSRIGRLLKVIRPFE